MSPFVGCAKVIAPHDLRSCHMGLPLRDEHMKLEQVVVCPISLPHYPRKQLSSKMGQ